MRALSTTHTPLLLPSPSDSPPLLPYLQGWVSEFTADRARILEPMSRYCWQSWGRVRLYTTMCGHAVHHDCWDAFYASMLQQVGERSRSMPSHVHLCPGDAISHLDPWLTCPCSTYPSPPCSTQMSNEDRYDGQYALDIGRREFVCPLCKTLSNVLVPHLPHHYSAPATPTPTPSPSGACPPCPPSPHQTTSRLPDDRLPAPPCAPPVPHLTTWLLSDVTSGPSPAGSQSLLAAVMCPEVASMPRPGLPEPLARAVRRFTDSMLEVSQSEARVYAQLSSLARTKPPALAADLHRHQQRLTGSTFLPHSSSLSTLLSCGLQVCEVGYSRLIVGTDSERSGRRQLLRTIYTAWSALAYSVMLDVVSHRSTWPTMPLAHWSSPFTSRPPSFHTTHESSPLPDGALSAWLTSCLPAYLWCWPGDGRRVQQRAPGPPRPPRTRHQGAAGRPPIHPKPSLP